MTENIILGFPNRVDGATLSGGAWVEAMPLDNLKDRLLSRIARTINVNLSSTWFVVDLTRQRALRVFSLIGHNLSFSARIRLRGSDDPAFGTTKYDQTFDAWPAAGGDWDIDALEWENDNFWLGSYNQEETEGQTAVSVHVLPDGVQARYWRVDLIDTQNDAGFVDVGRLFLGEAFLQPKVNMGYGASLGYETATAVETALGGAEFFDPRESLRVMRFQLAFMSEEEGFSKALELTRRAGIHREVFVIADPGDKLYGAQRNFLGRLRTLNPLEQAMFGLTSMSFEIKELR